MRKPFIAMITLVALMGVACGSGDGESSSNGSAGTSSLGASSSSASEAGSGSCPAGISPTDFTGEASFTMTTKDFSFHPNCLIAKSGSTLTITNKDTEIHNFTIFDTGVAFKIPGGNTKSKAIALAPASYYFYCTIHTGMTGTMIVVS